jgi:hypothetical protein
MRHDAAENSDRLALILEGIRRNELRRGPRRQGIPSGNLYVTYADCDIPLLDETMENHAQMVQCLGEARVEGMFRFRIAVDSPRKERVHLLPDDNCARCTSGKFVAKSSYQWTFTTGIKINIITKNLYIKILFFII